MFIIVSLSEETVSSSSQLVQVCIVLQYVLRRGVNYYWKYTVPALSCSSIHIVLQYRGPCSTVLVECVYLCGIFQKYVYDLHIFILYTDIYMYFLFSHHILYCICTLLRYVVIWSRSWIIFIIFSEFVAVSDNFWQVLTGSDNNVRHYIHWQHQI